MISIVIPVYNQAEKLGKCFDSILAQNILERQEKLEVIVVNDGSADNVLSVFKKYDPLFDVAGVTSVYVDQENQGANAARNRGAKEAQGEYMIFCDADVIMEHDMLSVMLDTLVSHPEASYAYSSFWWGRKLFKLHPFDSGRLKQMPYIHTTSLIRRAHFLGFDVKVKKFQDWDLWLTMLERGNIGVWTGRPLYRVVTGGTMSDWLPAFAYKIFPFLPAVKKYKEAMKIIKDKHGI